MPLVDALMRELKATGYMSNRGRMIVACYFGQDLKQDWRFGAYHFQETLIDHDFQSNFGGWSLTTGIQNRFHTFNVMSQSNRFDEEGKFIKQWVPELNSVPSAYIHSPWDMPKEVAADCGMQIADKHTNK